MFATFARSWQYTKMSYGILWQHKHLILFPILSSFAAILVVASFLLPLWGTGTLDSWMTFMDGEQGNPDAMTQAMMYITAFVFYYINYFVIVFFNTALIACALRILNGDEAGIGFGLRFAAKRLPEIMGWAFVSAIVGVILKVIENANERLGDLVAALLGSAWTAMTYFVVPVIVVEGAGPITAFKRSLVTLKSTWGTALTGNFSLGLISFLIMLPVLALMGALVYLAALSQSMVALVSMIALAVAVVMTVVAATSAAEAIFKAVLYRYATGRTLAVEVDTNQFHDAFRQRKRR